MPDSSAAPSTPWSVFVLERLGRERSRALKRALRGTFSSEDQVRFAVWIRGGSASGKTTLLKAVARAAHSLGLHDVLVEDAGSQIDGSPWPPDSEGKPARVLWASTDPHYLEVEPGKMEPFWNEHGIVVRLGDAVPSEQSDPLFHENLLPIDIAQWLAS